MRAGTYRLLKLWGDEDETYCITSCIRAKGNASLLRYTGSGTHQGFEQSLSDRHALTWICILLVPDPASPPGSFIRTASWFQSVFLSHLC